MGGDVGHGPAVGKGVHAGEVFDHPQAVGLVHLAGGLAHPQDGAVEKLADAGVLGLVQGAVEIHLGVHQVQQDPVGIGQGGEVIVYAKTEVIIVAFDGKGRTFGLLSAGGHSQAVHHVVIQI